MEPGTMLSRSVDLQLKLAFRSKIAKQAERSTSASFLIFRKNPLFLGEANGLLQVICLGFR